MGDVLTKEERAFLEEHRPWSLKPDGTPHAVPSGEFIVLIDRLVSEVERLRAASKAAFACIECDGEVKADEDGCCSGCGNDCFVLIGLPAEREILRHDISARFEAEVERLRARNESLERVAKAAESIKCAGPVEYADRVRLSAALSALAEPGKGGAT